MKLKIFKIILLFELLFLKTKAKAAIVPEACRSGVPSSQECGIREMIVTALNVFQFLLGILGSLVLFYFIYGGFIWMLSRGNAQMIEKGKNILFGTIIGMAIVLASWVIINFVLFLLLGGDIQNVQIFNHSWWVVPR